VVLDGEAMSDLRAQWSGWKRRMTRDPYPTRCRCGAEVHLLRRGQMMQQIVLLPSGHNCQWKELQDGVIRTIAAEELTGARITDTEVHRRLARWGVGIEIPLQAILHGVAP